MWLLTRNATVPDKDSWYRGPPLECSWRLFALPRPWPGSRTATQSRDWSSSTVFPEPCLSVPLSGNHRSKGWKTALGRVLPVLMICTRMIISCKMSALTQKWYSAEQSLLPQFTLQRNSEWNISFLIHSKLPGTNLQPTKICPWKQNSP